jgi:hypothetical protein
MGSLMRGEFPELRRTFHGNSNKGMSPRQAAWFIEGAQQVWEPSRIRSDALSAGRLRRLNATQCKPAPPTRRRGQRMLTKENADQLYAALTQLADRMPDFSNGDGVHEKQVWLSQLYAVITEVDEPKDAIFVRSTSNFADKGLRRSR